MFYDLLKIFRMGKYMKWIVLALIGVIAWMKKDYIAEMISNLTNKNTDPNPPAEETAIIETETEGEDFDPEIV